MKRLATSTAIATLLAGAAFAQDTTTTVAEPAGGGMDMQAMQSGGDILLGTQLTGMQVFARPQDEAMAVSSDMASEDLAGLDSVGQISDILVGRDGSMAGVIVALSDPAVAPGEGYATSETGPVGTEGVRFGNEVMIPVESLTFVADEATPNVWWAVLDMSPEELAEAQPIDRTAMATPVAGNVDTTATGTLGATGANVTNPSMWRGNRTAWTAPAIQRDGYSAVPVSEVSAENLRGATVYGATGERIGNVGQIVLGQDPSEVGYIVLDIGGFLGIGGRNVAVGLDEMTILRTEGWDEIQVHVDATEETLRSMQEYQG